MTSSPQIVNVLYRTDPTTVFGDGPDPRPPAEWRNVDGGPLTPIEIALVNHATPDDFNAVVVLMRVKVETRRIATEAGREMIRILQSAWDPATPQQSVGDVWPKLTPEQRDRLIELAAMTGIAT